MSRLPSLLVSASLGVLLLLLVAFATPVAETVSPVVTKDIHPLVVTQPTRHDTDDPAIWVNPADPAKSLILGTDKNRDGALYVFDLNGQVIADKVVQHLQRPNNVDVEYGLTLGGRSIDIAVVTERLTEKLRIFRLPDMQPVDGGGIPVFSGEPSVDYRAPMGIALYRRPDDGAIFAIVSRKHGPRQGYLWQYRLQDNGRGKVEGVLERKFGAFHGTKEIEAIAVDDELGYVYYSDEDTGIRQYYADPRKGSEELALFGTDGFTGDREGIAIYPTGKQRGYIVVSDQKANRFRIFRREGEPGQPFRHPLLKIAYTDNVQCDGCDATPVAVDPRFPHGLFVAMSNDRTFQYYRWEDLAGSDLEWNTGAGQQP